MKLRRKPKPAKLKRILIDARMVRPIGHGIARYVQLMAKGLREHYGDQPLPYEPIFLVFDGVTVENFHCVTSRVPFLHPREVFAIPWIARRLHVDAYHSTSFSSVRRLHCPWIVTPHDLIHLRYGNTKQKLYYRFMLKPFIRAARRVTTVSEYSRAQIAHWAQLPWERIDVVYNAIEPPRVIANLDEVLADFGLKRGQYFLCLSNMKAHKNLPTLLRAYPQFRREVKGERLREPWTLVITASLLAPIEGVQSLGGVKEHEAQALVQGAGALVFPSLDEGFGRPPLEAAVAGVPIIVSRIAPHQEALMDFQHTDELAWVSPLDVPAWANALRKGFDGKIPGASPATRQLVLDRYSVKRLGAHMDRIYRDVLGIES